MDECSPEKRSRQADKWRSVWTLVHGMGKWEAIRDAGKNVFDPERTAAGTHGLGWRIPYFGSRNPSESARNRPSTESVRIRDPFLWGEKCPYRV